AHLIIDKVFARYGLSEDMPIPAHLHDKILHEITTRLACNAAGLPFEMAIPADRIAAALGRK
ncbi:MAG: hypothetical protein ACRCWO_13430, partial [Bosea sp. (in: a-proteobacteria)]